MDTNNYKVVFKDGMFDIFAADSCDKVEGWFIFEVFQPNRVSARVRCESVACVFDMKYLRQG